MRCQTRRTYVEHTKNPICPSDLVLLFLSPAIQRGNAITRTWFGVTKSELTKRRQERNRCSKMRVWPADQLSFKVASEVALSNSNSTTQRFQLSGYLKTKQSIAPRSNVYSPHSAQKLMDTTHTHKILLREVHTSIMSNNLERMSRPHQKEL